MNRLESRQIIKPSRPREQGGDEPRRAQIIGSANSTNTDFSTDPVNRNTEAKLVSDNFRIEHRAHVNYVVPHRVADQKEQFEESSSSTPPFHFSQDDAIAIAKPKPLQFPIRNEISEYSNNTLTSHRMKNKNNQRLTPRTRYTSRPLEYTRTPATHSEFSIDVQKQPLTVRLAPWPPAAISSRSFVWRCSHADSVPQKSDGHVTPHSGKVNDSMEKCTFFLRKRVRFKFRKTKRARRTFFRTFFDRKRVRFKLLKRKTARRTFLTEKGCDSNF